MDQLRALRYFARVAETKSFTLAANEFSVPPSSLSRRIADLENSLGATLLKRTTRAVQLTEIGHIYYQQIEDILSRLAQSDEAVRNYQSIPMGMLRINAMAGLGEPILFPLLQEFRELYPEIVLDVSLSDELSTLGRDEVDIAIRGGYVPDERVQAILLMDNRFIAVAAPEYLKQFGTPKSPQELKKHKGLFYRTPKGPTPWLGKVNNEWLDVSGKPVAISNNGKWLGEQAVQGQGIMMAPRWTLARHLANKVLKELPFDPPLRVTHIENMAIYLLYQRQRYHVPKVKAAVDFFKERISNDLNLLADFAARS